MACLPYLSALKNATVFKGTLQMPRFIYLLTYLLYLLFGGSETAAEVYTLRRVLSSSVHNEE